MNKKTILFLISSIFSQCVSIFKSIISPLLLTPFQLGYLNLINLNIGYLANSHLGVLHGMARLAPQFESNGNLKFKNEIYRTSFWINIFFSFIFLFFFLLTSSKKIFLNKEDFIAFTLIVFFQQVFTFYYIFYRTEVNLTKLSVGSIIQSMSVFVLFPLSLYLLENKILAALISTLFSFILPFLYFIYPFQYYFIDRITLKTSLIILKNGFPILIVGFLDIVFMSIDKFFLSFFYGLEKLGFYSIGVLFLSMTSSLYGTYGSTLYPGMIEKFTRKGYDSASRSIILLPIILTSLSLQFIILASLAFVPSLITIFLPKYLNSINLICYFILGSYFFSIASVCLFYLNSINQTNVIKKIQIISILVISTECIVIVYFKLDYSWISIATLIGYFFYGFSILNFTLNKILIYNKILIRNLRLKMTLPYFVIVLIYFITIKNNNNNIYFYQLLSVLLVLIINSILYKEQIIQIINKKKLIIK